jgi:hypothetical protein
MSSIVIEREGMAVSVDVAPKLLEAFAGAVSGIAFPRSNAGTAAAAARRRYPAPALATGCLPGSRACAAAHEVQFWTSLVHNLSRRINEGCSRTSGCHLSSTHARLHMVWDAPH